MYKNPARRPLFRLLAPLVTGCIVYLLVLLAFDTHSRILTDFFNQELLVCIGISYLVLEANRLLAISFLNPRKHFWAKSALKVALALLLTSMICSTALILYFRYQLGLYYIISFYTELKVFNSIFLFIALLYQAYFLGFVWLRKQYEQQIAAEEDKGLRLDHQIRQFCHSVQPEFLFAGLENVIMKIREQQEEQADSAITLLADLYHYFLRPQQELVPLQEEMAVVSKLQQLLLQTGRHISISAELQNANSLLVPASLVRLIEAIAHSQLSSAAAPLLLHVKQEQQQLSISFISNFSLTNHNKLEKMLISLQQQYAWLGGNSLSWSGGSQYQILIPTETLELYESHHH